MVQSINLPISIIMRKTVPVTNITIIISILNLPFCQCLRVRRFSVLYTFRFETISIHVTIIDTIYLKIEILAVTPILFISSFGFLLLPLHILIKNTLDLTVRSEINSYEFGWFLLTVNVLFRSNESKFHSRSNILPKDQHHTIGLHSNNPSLFQRARYSNLFGSQPLLNQVPVTLIARFKNPKATKDLSI